MEERSILVQVLGPVRAWRDNRELDLGPAGRRAVLGLLVLARGQPMSRAELVDTLWGDRPPPTAANVLQTHVKHLRRQLEPDRRPHAPSGALPAVGDGYALRVPGERIDLARFRGLTTSAAAAGREGDLRQAAAWWGEALQLWRGAPLADIPMLANHPKVLALAGERQSALARYCEAMLDSGAAAEILPLVEEIAAGQPFDEAAQARLIRAYQAVGKRAQAFARYREVRTRLVDELGVEPGPVLTSAHAALLRDRPADGPSAGGPSAGGPSVGGAGVGGAGALDAAPASTGPPPVESPLSPIRPATGGSGVPPAPAGGPPAGDPAGGREPGAGAAPRLREGGARAEEPVGDPPGTPSSSPHTPSPHTSSPPQPSAAVVPTQLPADVYGFTGRQAELRRLDRFLTLADGAVPADVPFDTEAVHSGEAAPAPMVIVAICGTAGVGKTALAVHWAHRIRARFPGGQLYLNLRGHDHDQPMTAGDALARLLSGLGVAGPEIPVDLDERAARFRSELGDRPMLIVLDNAASVEQLRPLLPGTPACMVLVTSRDSLAGLVALHGAHRLTLEPLPPADTVTLLRRLIGARAHEEPRAVTALAEQCARLPLMLRVAAELAATRPGSSLRDLVTELADQRRRLHLLDAGGDPRAAVRTVLSWSYLHLADGEALAFRRLGLHPGTDVDVYATAALAGVESQRAERTLAALARAHLIQPAGVDRWTMHDLLRAYAAETCQAEEPEPARTAALDRLLLHYVATASAAMNVLYPAERHHRPGVADPDNLVRPLPDAGAARAWLDAERATLVAVCEYAAGHGWPEHATSLSTILYRYLESGHYPDALSIHGYALQAARRAGNTAGEAHALTNLGAVHRLYGRYREAIDHQERALILHRRGGDRYGQARTLSNLGIVQERLGRRGPAAEHQRQALDIYRELGDRYGEAAALTNLGNVYTELGRHEEAAELFGLSLSLFRALGDQVGEAIGLTNLGDVHVELGRYETAAGHLHRALALFRTAGHRMGEATALSNLGRVHTRLGRHDLAAEELDHALLLFEEIGHRYGEASALNALGEALHATGRADDALARHTAALAIAVETGDRDEQTRAHRGITQAELNGATAAPGPGHWPLTLPLATDVGSIQSS